MSFYEPRDETGFPDDDGLLRAIAQTRDELNCGVDELKGCLSCREPNPIPRVTATTEHPAAEAVAVTPDFEDDARPRRAAPVARPVTPSPPPMAEDPRPEPASTRPQDTLARLDALAQRLGQRMKSAPVGAPGHESKD